MAIVRRRDGRRKSVMTYTHTHTERLWRRDGALANAKI